LAREIKRGPWHLAEHAELLVDGAEAFDAMLGAIASAREEVLLETYIMRDDRIGERVADALGEIAARGVRVYVLADAVGSLATASEFWERLEARGVVVRHFHRLRYLPFEALRRDHRKIVVVDRSVAFTGGMNIGEEYGSSLRMRDDAWRDTLVRVDGSVAVELAAVFAEGWDRAKGPPLPDFEYIAWETATQPALLPTGPAYSFARLRQASKRWGATQLRQRLSTRLGARRDRRTGRRVRRAGGIVAADATQVAMVLDSRPGRGQREVLAVLASLTGAARARLWITTPYFAPPTRALSLLKAAARRGVDVRLLVPSARTDVALVRHAAHGAYHTLLTAGVRIFEYTRATLHSKTVVVDGHAGVIGSTNLDFRSFWLNAECNVLLLDDTIADALERAFEHDTASSDEIMLATWSRRPWWHRLGDWCARQLRWAL
jgi:cardiolipin synthase